MALTSGSATKLRKIADSIHAKRCSPEIDSLFSKFLLVDQRDLRDRKPTFRLPHWLNYYSNLTPVFLEKIEDIDLLTNLSPLVIRDGILSLSYFFHRNPDPFRLGPESVLLVNRRFAAFIPTAWTSRVAYYSVERTEDAPGDRTEISDLYLILTAISERHCSHAFLRNELQKIRSMYGARLEQMRIHLLPLVHARCTRESLETEIQSELLITYAMEIRKQLGVDAHSVSWKEVQQSRLGGAGFVDFNEFDFYYSDSFVIQFFLNRGAVPVLPRTEARAHGIFVPTSLCHGLIVDDGGASHRHGGSPDLLAEIRNFVGTSSYLDEERAFDLEVRSPKNLDLDAKVCPRSFESLIYELARKYEV